MNFALASSKDGKERLILLSQAARTGKERWISLSQAARTEKSNEFCFRRLQGPKKTMILAHEWV